MPERKMIPYYLSNNNNAVPINRDNARRIYQDFMTNGYTIVLADGDSVSVSFEEMLEIKKDLGMV